MGAVMTLDEAVHFAETLRAQGKRLVLTNGHFIYCTSGISTIWRRHARWGMR